MTWRMWVLGLALTATACSGDPPGNSGFDNSGNLPTPEATATATEGEAASGRCSPELSGQSDAFELVLDSDVDFKPYYRLVFGYSNLCGEAQNGRMVVTAEGPNYTNTYYYFLSVADDYSAVDADAATISVDIPVIESPQSRHTFEATFYDTLGYASNEVTGSYIPQDESTPTEAGLE